MTTELENELKQLKPRGLSDAARNNIRREAESLQPFRPALEQATDGPGIFRGHRLMRVAAVLALAAGLAAVFFLTRKDAPVAPATMARVREPAPITNEPSGSVSLGTVLVDARDEGTIADPRYGPVRRVRYRFVDNVRWDRPRRGGAVIERRPREEIVLVSVPVD